MTRDITRRDFLMQPHSVLVLHAGAAAVEGHRAAEQVLEII